MSRFHKKMSTDPHEQWVKMDKLQCTELTHEDIPEAAHNQVEQDGPTPICVDMAVLWLDCTHAELVRGFLENVNVNPTMWTREMPSPVKQLVQESAKSWAFDSPMYMAMLSCVTAQQITDDLFRNLAHELAYNQSTDQHFAWEHLVIAFTWASVMLTRWAGRYPRIAQFLETYLRISEEQMAERGGWRDFARWSKESD
jgi:hypothetical protein